MPKLKGLKLGEARKRLEKAGCKLGKHPKHPKHGAVVSDSHPNAGRTLKLHAKVDVSLAKPKHHKHG